MYKRNNIVIQFIQNGILLLHNNNIKEYQLTSVNNYKVINKHLIIEELTNIINKQKINQNILQSNITIIIDSTYTKLDKENIETIFKEIYFNKIKFINLPEILKQTKKELIIDLSQNNIKYYYLNEAIEQKIYFLEYTSNLESILNNVLSIHNIESIKIFGNNTKNKKIIKKIEEITNKPVYIYSHPNLIPLILLT